MARLIFIDTNIFLDFYRIRSREAGMSILGKLERHRDALITSDQVVMEFKKNRQSALTETHRGLKTPDTACLALPPLLAESNVSKAIRKHRRGLETQTVRAKKRIEQVFASPNRYDPVYRALKRIAQPESSYHLSVDAPVFADVQSRAAERYQLGYPPRKAADTSIGDGINWEWIISCAKESGAGVVIVTRDGDFGGAAGGKPILNDFLREEFRKRVSARRSIVLTDRITDALKQLSITVSKTEEAAANALVSAQPPRLDAPADLMTQLRQILSTGASIAPGGGLTIGPGSGTSHLPGLLSFQSGDS